MLIVKIKNRDFSERNDLDWVRFTATQLSWKAEGGPDLAQLSAEGGNQALWELVELLRCPVEVWDTEIQDLVWWGYVDGLELQIDGIGASVELGPMTNRVAVTFSSLTPGVDLAGGRFTTAWADNADSQGVYGVKELLQSQAGTSAVAASALRDKTLDIRKYPMPKIGLAPASQAGKSAAVLKLKGWWHTLDWLYWANPAGREMFESGGSQDWIGAWWPDWKYDQPFSTVNGSPTWQCDRVQIRAKKIGSPADNLVVDLCADSGGNPGTVLGSGQLAGPGISWNMRLEELLISPMVTIAPATAYHLVTQRSNAAPDGYNYFMVDTYQGSNETITYPRGQMKVHNGTSWATHAQPCFQWFKVLGAQETTVQIAAAAARQTLIAGVDVDTPSGVYANQFRIGDHHLSTEIAAWLATGTVAGRQLLARVRANRRLWVYEEPAPGVNDWGLLSNGEIRNEFDQPVSEWQDCSGVWLRLRDVLPGTVNVTRLADVKRVFVVGCSWALGRGRTFESR